MNDKCPDCGRDHPIHPLKKPGMTFLQFRDRIAEICEQMYQVGIFIKESKHVKISTKDGKLEPGYTLSEKFAQRWEEHKKIQEEIEYVDKQRGIDSQKDYGGTDRDTYILGITINDFCKVSPKDCKTCRHLIIKIRGNDNAQDIFMEHWKKDHPDLYEKHELLGKYIGEWIVMIQDMTDQNNRQKEWRSN
jgi:hypothetical protein